ncbi:MAG TPA: PQQ-dependent sugar dehydrogenase [Gemmataceae bacterium]|nr:PQQ-dependent sugar dehydrogenase [Gemmataceae bacterium]
MTRKTRSVRPARRSASLRLDLLEDRVTPTILPSGFTDALVASGFSAPTAMEFAPDGRLFVLEQGGKVKLVQSGGTTFTALTLTVSSSGERGLLGIAFDPNFASNKFVYLYYTNPNAGAASWATGIHNQLSRFTVNDTNPQQPLFINEAPILDWNTLSGATNHNGGAIHFGKDGMLYANAGDNVQTFVGPDNNTYRVSQTLDNLLGKQLRIDVAKFNSSLATRDDTAVGHLIPADNPFVGTATGINQLIYVLGLRNPFTFAVQPGTGRIFINDVGEATWEEIDDSIAGGNYGWRGGATDGFGHPPPAFAAGTYHDPLLAYNHSGGPAGGGAAIVGGTFYDPATAQFPASYVGKYFYQDLAAGWIRVFDPATPGSANNPDTSTGFATGTPGALRDLKVDSVGNLYYLSGADGAVHRIAFQAPTITQQPTDVTVNEGQPASFSVTATGGPPLSYQWQKQINIAWANINGATSSTFTIGSTTQLDAAQYRVIVTNSAGSATSNPATLTVNVVGQAPIITQQPTNLTVNVGQPANFSVTATGTVSLSYQWQKLINTTWTDVAGATSATFSIASAATADAGQYRVIVTNSLGSATSNAATLTVNQFPTATITAPATYTFGQTINFSGTATDPEQGTLPASAFTWRVDFGHKTHFHPHVPEFGGATGGSFVADFNEADPDQFYRIILTVTDANGASTTVTKDVLPVKVKLTLAANPSGAGLSIDGQPVTGPVESVVGMDRTIEAPPITTVNGVTIRFANWSDRGAATHVVNTPASDTTYVATYTTETPGLTAEFFDFTTPLTVLPNLTGLTPDVTRIDSTVRYPATMGRWPGLDARFNDTFASRHTGYLRVDTAGSYTLFVTSNDGSKVWLDGELLIDNDGRHVMRGRSATRTLTVGSHSLRTEFFEDAGAAGLVLQWKGPGIAKQVIPVSHLSHDAPATLRAFRQDAGGDGLAVMEAEHFDASVGQGGKNWVANYNLSGFSGEGTMQAVPNTGVARNTGYLTNSPRLDFRVNFTHAGAHYVWIRGRAPTTADDTLHVGLDGAAVATSDRIGPLKPAYGWVRNTLDHSVATIDVTTPGIHTVNVWMREDGAVVDKLLLATNPDFVPTGTGPAESPRDSASLDFSGGFAGATGLTANGSAGFAGSSARLTDGGTSQAGSLFSTNKVSTAGFATAFDFQLTSAAADGFAFVIQGAGNTALGLSGSGLGYQGIGTSAAIKFDLFDNAGEGASSTGLYTNGAAPTGGATDLLASGIDLHSGHVFRVSVAYVGTNLSVAIRDLTTGATAAQSYNVDIPGLVGGTTAYFGFTGGTSGQTAVQDILNWTYWG